MLVGEIAAGKQRFVIPRKDTMSGWEDVMWWR